MHAVAQLGALPVNKEGIHERINTKDRAGVKRERPDQDVDVLDQPVFKSQWQCPDVTSESSPSETSSLGTQRRGESLTDEDLEKLIK